MRRTTILILPALLLAFTGCARLGLGREKPYEESIRRTGWHLFLRPVQVTPGEQIAYADGLREAGRIRAAMRQYVALAVKWPDAAEAVEAQYEYARLLEERRKYYKAFDEYNRLFEEYPGRFAYDDVVERQFAIATYLMNRRKGTFLFLPGFTAPERAIPFFESILTNAPQWEKAAEVQYLIGQAYEKSFQEEEAIGAYMTTQQRYPESDFAQQAAFGTIRCYEVLTKELPNDDHLLENAWAATVLSLNNYPDAPDAAAARDYRDRLHRQRARLAYNKAHFYDAIARRPEAALIAYRNLLRRFPQSDWTATAQQRIDALSQNAPEEEEHEDEGDDASD